jgi:D-sedoheptulose 7-phosphate isomerase
MTNNANIKSHFDDHAKVVQRTLDALAEKSTAAGSAMISALRSGRKVICFGNGGSATQASHLAGELIGRFQADRRPLPAIALGSDAGAVTCISNDYGYEVLFERQINALAERGDIVVGITTSGKSANVLRGLAAARAKGAITIALTGEAGLATGDADHLLAVPSMSTAHIQELHLMLLHTWCISIDAELGSK